MDKTEIAPFAISCGDPAGIGPEVIIKSWLNKKSQNLYPFFAVGDIQHFQALQLCPVQRIEQPCDAASCFEDALPVLHIHDGEPAILGQPSLDGAQCALHALEVACGLTRSGDAGAIITGPVSKTQLYKVGFTFPGQTEFVSERCGVSRNNSVMMLAGPSLRVIPMTTHIPLSQVPGLLTEELMEARIWAAKKAMLRNFGIAEPRIAVAGLNPHAGEDGNLGEEETRIISPVLEKLRQEGLQILGPLAADTMFHENAREKYDVALCTYHDQALIPLKTLHFFDGINMTLGLPIVRTSPDHGTAFNIASDDQANPLSMQMAIKMAETAAKNRLIYDN